MKKKATKYVPGPAAVRMRRLRERRRLSQEKFAQMVSSDLVHCSQVMICQLESGERPIPSLKIAHRIAVVTKQLGRALPINAWLKERPECPS